MLKGSEFISGENRANTYFSTTFVLNELSCRLVLRFSLVIYLLLQEIFRDCVAGALYNITLSRLQVGHGLIRIQRQLMQEDLYVIGSFFIKSKDIVIALFCY